MEKEKVTKKVSNKKNSTKKVSTKVDIDKKELINFIGDIVSSCYGVVGLAQVLSVKSFISSLKGKEYQSGIDVKEDINGHYVINVYLVLAYGLKITEIINEISKRLSYFLKKHYGDIFKTINVYIEDLKVL